MAAKVDAARSIVREFFYGIMCLYHSDSPSRSCSGNSSDAIYIGYYESWSKAKECDVVLPENINVKPWTVSLVPIILWPHAHHLAAFVLFLCSY